ncbi:MAG: oligosaccharide flippase family protein [Anaerolineales bacterium]|nr:oligosaccharide flippase family protein [Anaerolineales bacterium]MCB8954696.1 oligosaccharide flippase family protein [Ardenticatenales bacterium]
MLDRDVTKNSSAVHRVVGDAALAFVVGILGRGALYLSQFLLARWLGPLQFGLFSVSLTIMQLGSVATGVGLYTAAVRFVAIYADQSNGRAVRELLQRSSLIVLFVGGILSLSMVIWSRQWALLLREAQLAQIMPIMALALPVLTLLRLFVSGINGLGLARSRTLLESALPSLLFVSGILLLHFRQALLLPSVGYWYVLSFAVAAGISGYVLIRQTPAPGAGGRGVVWRQVFAFSVPAWGIALLNQLAQRLDVVLAGIFLGGADIGIYSAAAVVTWAMGFIMTAFNMAVAPSFAAGHHGHNSHLLRNLYREGTRLLVLLGAPLAILLIIGAGDLMRLLGDAFSMGRNVLIILVIGQVCNLMVGSAGNLLIMTGFQRIELALVLASVLFNVVAARFAVPRFGLVGLALAASAATTLLNLSRLLMVYWRLRLHPYARSYGKIVVAVAVAGICGWSAHKLLHLTALAQLSLLAIIIAVVYLLVLLALGLEAEEKAMLRKGARIISLRLPRKTS